MNNQPRQKLCELINTYGQSLCDDTRRCEGLLRDFCGEHKREVFVLASALKERVAADLLSSSSSVPSEVLLARLEKRLCDNLGLSEDAAQWAVESWALALGVISSAESQRRKPKPVRPEQPAQAGIEDATAPQLAVINVSQLGSSKNRSVSQALAIALPDATIYVQPGVYRESLRIEKPVTLIGEGEPDSVVIEATDGNAVYFNATEGQIKNLTLKYIGTGEFSTVDIVGGRLTLEDCDITNNAPKPDHDGSRHTDCVEIHGTQTNPIIRNNKIHDALSGVGIWIHDGSQGIIEDNEIYENKSGGVQISDRANPAVINNEIYENEASEVTIATEANPTVRNNRIFDGKSAGVFVHGNGRGTIENNDIHGNALSGVVIKTGAAPIVKDNKIHENKQNGILVAEKGEGTIEDNDIYENQGNGIRVCNKGKGTFENNEMWENVKGPWAIDEDCQVKTSGSGSVPFTEKAQKPQPPDKIEKISSDLPQEPIATLTGGLYDSVYSVAFSPDGRILAGRSRVVQLESIGEKREIATLYEHSGSEYIQTVTFSPDGKLIASGGETYAHASDRCVFKLWSVTEGRAISTYRPSWNKVQSVAFSPDGKTLAVAGSEGVSLWSVQQRRWIATLKGHSSMVSSVAFSPDGKTIVSGSWDKTIKLWRVREEWDNAPPKKKAIGKFLSSVGIKEKRPSIPEEEEIATLTGHNERVESVAFSPDGLTIVSCSFDRTVKLWSISERSLISTLMTHEKWVSSVAFSPNGKVIASGGWDGAVKLWSIQENREIATLTEKYPKSVYSVAFSPDGKQLVSGGKDGILIWDVSSLV